MAELTLEQKIEVFEYAQQLFSESCSLSIGNFARDASGRIVSYSSNKAVRFCARGGVSRGLLYIGYKGKDSLPNHPTADGLCVEAVKLLCLETREYQTRASDLAIWSNHSYCKTVYAGFGVVVEKLKAELATNT